MMTWDERAMERANLFYNQYEFIAGAVWQRKQLLTDETVERAARALNIAGCTCLAWAHEPGEYDDCHYCRGTCLNMARTALTAAIGDQS